jgi:DNA helicase-2/ATP-dependent DNA helicase PcrA
MASPTFSPVRSDPRPAPAAAAEKPPRIDPFVSLNDQQRSAVEHGFEGDVRASPPRLIVAGAGSGKTKTLASRVARLIAAGADPRRILMLTFSRRAAVEMAQRAGRLVQQALGLPSHQPAPKLDWAGTFHGIGARLLREYAPHIGLADTFTVLDRSDAEDLLDVVRHERSLSKTKARFPMKGTCLSIYSRVVNSDGELRAVLRDHFPWCATWEAELKALFAAYTQAKQTQQLLDFDDLLLYWAALMEDPLFAQHVGDRFDHVLIDEYQDTNRLQATILQRMKPHGRGVVAVGDDAQAIYSFRAAEVRNILDFAQQFAVPAEVITLDRNYRSTQPLLDASNAVIALATERYAKQLWSATASSRQPLLVSVEDEMAQARWVADEVLANRERGMALKAQAVLFRTSHHSAALELELVRRNVPFLKFGGLKFLEAAHIKDVLSVLRWAENPHNTVAGFRVAKLIPGVGPATARKLVDAVAEGTEPLPALRAFKAPPAAANDLPAFVSLYITLRESSPLWPNDLQQVIDWYAPHLQQAHDDAAVRMADLVQLKQIASAYRSRERFLTELALDPPSATSDESGDPSLDEDYLNLSTIHSAKGQEWRAVSVLNVVDGAIPCDIATGSAAEVEEERRLLYVAMTRAKEQLNLLVPQRYYVHRQGSQGDRHVYASLTRFIPPGVAQHFERQGPICGLDAMVVPGLVGPSNLPAGATPIDMAARLAKRWQ